MGSMSGGGGGKAGRPPGMPPPSPGMQQLSKLPGAPPMPGQGLGGIARSIQSLPGFGGGTGISSGQQGDMPWQSTGKPADQEAEAQRLLGYGPGKPWEVPAPAAPAGGGMFGAGGGGNQALTEFQLNNAQQGMRDQAMQQGAAGQMGGMFGGGTPMAKPGMQDMMARMLGSAAPTPMPAMPAPAAAMGEPASYGKSGGGGGKGKAAAGKAGRR